MNSKRLKTIWIYLQTLSFSLRITFEASPIIMTFRLLVMGLSSFVPIINIMAMKNIINGLEIRDRNLIFDWFIVLGATQLITAIVGQITSYLATIHADRISFKITNDIIDKINELDISYFDNPKLYDEMVNVTRDINSVPSLVWKVISSIQVFIQLLTAAAILFHFIWWSPFVIIAACLPNMILDKKYAMKMYYWSRDSVNNVRQMKYTYSALTSKYFGKDIRINRLTDYLKDKYIGQWSVWYKSKRKLLNKQFIASFITMIIPHIITLVFTVIVILRIISSQGTIGDFSYYIGIMGQLTSSTFGLITAVSQIIQQKVKIEYYNNFKDWKPLISNNQEGINLNEINVIEFKNVSFKYPNTTELVLKNISFKITKNEKIGIVGKNGCGKSTLIKLLLHLYEPDEGEILINNININDINANDYYKVLSVMPQDYINYAFTVKENTMLADVDNKNMVDEKVIQACRDSDAYDFVAKWEMGILSYLTKNFDEQGKELSGGQWQKLALARFFYKQAQIYIMDEPSASLDIESEYKIFHSVFERLGNSTLILISHRLSNLRMMDKIIVMDNGKISEMGSHDELVQSEGIYAQLYNIQKQKL
ncbi:MAG: ABC transporter ATP-binding protein [Lachnospiraceae bacterium]|nr:ABC transporter ATP-binding protein [Lachnospiraceae bacterium]